ncbi:reprolysin-like metallopeptidase [Saprospira grandis]|uniref:reprolysin-like metallopeptidase n=1 Tax=Saprospira grandis TaxID=1008 RepID=UPI0022DD95AA|nr:zinc-dependent metalloprotease family protein [Saprospira grandis]WBM74406.1 T9SS type A sorting domain-containing protein [Saprospira grandis]
MQLTYLRSFLLAWLLLLGSQLWGQTELWSPIAEDQIPKSGTRYIFAEQYQTVRLNLDEIRAILDVAPMERTPIAAISQTLLSLPMPDGSYEVFDIVESPIMETELAEKFPEIQTYAGRSINDPSKSLRFDLTPQGFHAIILTAGKGTIYIDPYQFGGGDIEHYIVYNRRDFRPAAPKQFVCGLTANNIPLSNFKAAGQTAARFGSCELRTYRMAVAATGEYTQFHGGTVALALAAQTTTINRVNSVYEREMAIRMNLVANNNLIIYTNATTDPYTNGAPGTMITENQANIDTEIGSANYDIGHVFGTNSGGLAGLGVVCSNSGKARGVTGSAAPIGDPFDIDYVAHEVGHQFGCNHTQNNNCNRNNATAMEPGSASTIMGYAGICAPNVQNQSDDYFHSISLEEMGAFITGAGHNCPATTALANNAPTVNAPAANINIPANTPFSLTASATDPDGNTLTYSWEQMENATATMPPVASSTAGPNFRSFEPVTDPTRYFPNLVDLAAGGPFTWEVLPSVSRVMDFRVTVRDNAAGGGCTDHADMQVTVDANSGPFVVLYPSASGISWNGGGTETVTWDVAGTDGSPVSCANVDILLSTDGGLTYPTVLASNVPNDGTEPISVPNVGTTTGRIMVRCANGYFFDISDNDFTIVLATNDYTLSTTNNSQSVCAAATPSYSIDVGQIGSYSDPVTLSLSGLPTGVVGNFSINPVTPASSSTLSLNVSGATAAGSYPFTVNASSTSGNKSLALTLIVNDPAPTAVTLNSPANGATAVALPVNFDWSAAAGASYDISIATDAAFTNIVDQATGLSSPNYTSNVLGTGTQYFWQVIATNSCGSSPAASASFSSGLQACDTISNYDVANDNPALYNAGGPGGYLAGHNGYGDIAKADYFNYGGANTHLTGAYFGFGQAVAANASNSFNVQVWDGTGGTPGAVIASIPIAYQDIVTLIAGGNNVAFVPFGNIALPASNEFFVGIEYTYGNDTIALITNTDGETSPATAWEQWGDGTWHAYDETGSWGIDVAHYIVPVLGTLPSANFSPNNSTICLGNSITFNNSSTDADSYEWFFPGGSPASSTAMNPSVSYNTAGTYDVALVATNDCISDTLIVLSAITVSEVVTGIGSSDESCAGNDGTATVSATSGTAPYTFLWSDGQTTATASGLSAANYFVTVTDANGCTAVSSVAVTLNCSCTLAATTSATDASCNASNDGSATAIATAGTTPYSFLWSDGQTTATASNLIAGTYIVTVTDAAGCTTTATAVVNEPTALVASASSSDETCAGNDGTATATISGGTAGYTFLWSDGQTTATANNLVAGTYTVTITDANGCQTTATAVVNNSCTPCTLAASTSATDASCNASNDGSATAIATAGTTPYSFLWSDGQTTATATNLIAGTYTVTVTDAAGCITTATAVVNEPTALVASASSSDETCAGNDGTATATISGGTAGYTFLWSDGQTTATASNLIAGTYTVTITDANGCTTVATAVVNNSCTPCTLAATTSATDASCNASNDGSATAIATAGTTPYSFIWSDGQTTATATNLIAGTYIVTVTDAAGCTTTATAVVNEPTALLASASSSDETCAGNDGTATATISGGTAGYTFLWSDGQTTATATNLVAGTYTVSITDANGCTTVATAVVNNSCTPCTLAATTSATDASCNASNDGSATAIATAGTTPYSFLWSDGQTTATASNLIAGTYIVTVTDAAGCTTTATAVVNEPTALVASASSSDETCAGNDGTATATISGGTAGYTFLWSDGQTTATANNLVAGTYTVTITDANGCTTVATAVVNYNCPCNGSLQLTPTDVSCASNCNGSISLQSSGLQAPISYRWTNGATVANPINLCGGNYSVTATDVNGCVAVASTTVAQPTAMTLATGINNESCAGSDGNLTAIVNGGTTPYTFAWSNGANTSSLTALAAGVYQLTVTDANACDLTAAYTVALDNSLASNAIASQNASCAGYADGEAQAVGTGTGLPMNYSWSNGANTQVANGLAAGNYTVTISSGVCSAVRSVQVTEPAAMQIQLMSTEQNCVPGTGALALNVSGGGGAPYSYLWSNGATTANVSNLANGNYSVTITSANGCEEQRSASFNIPQGPVLSSLSSSPNCSNTADGSLDLTVSPAGNYLYSWSNGANTEDLQGLAGGIYQVSVTDTAQGCTVVLSDTVNAPASLQVAFSVTQPHTPTSNNGALAASENGGTAPFSYLWSTGDSVSQLTNVGVGSYSVTVTDANGCTATDSIFVSAVTGINVQWAEAFSLYPNPSNGQMQLELVLQQSQQLELAIFDVLGRQLYQQRLSGQQFSLPLSFDWPAGTYFLRLSSPEGQISQKFVIRR